MAASLMVAMATAALNLCAPFHDEAKDRYGYLQCDGSPGLPAQYRVADDFTAGGIAAVLDATGWYYIDRQGRFLLRPMIYDNGPDYFVEGLSRFIQDGKTGFFDEAGQVVIPATYDFAYPFKDGVAEVGQRCTTTRQHEHSIVSCQAWSTIKHPATPATSR
ncbi:WG repeat-containing protein [Pigmentiphaga aceris]|uniref:WG repeat-containing protein n=1 Tax=Pigmentiphaga aceris TaxID=1940612 RepID=A0A5C0AVJ9_9BURK|nr:WG repeat-containing protein [Pigmentiphaga aceris]QEI06449.1 WG repeat-containing protein [Pigmentiphaga aceris]